MYNVLAAAGAPAPSVRRVFVGVRGAAAAGRAAPRLLTDQQMQRGSPLKEPTENCCKLSHRPLALLIERGKTPSDTSRMGVARHAASIAAGSVSIA